MTKQSNQYRSNKITDRSIRFNYLVSHTVYYLLQIPIFTDKGNSNKRNKHLGEQKICLGLSFVSFAKMKFLLTAVLFCCQAGGLLAQGNETISIPY